MITLTNPIPVTTVLGSTGKTNYDRLILSMFTYDLAAKNISGHCSLTASGNANAAPIQGTFNIPSSGTVTVTIPSLPFYASIVLTAPQTAVVLGWMASGQNAIEAGLVAIGLAAGLQSAG